jgi:hypothetical protein
MESNSLPRRFPCAISFPTWTTLCSPPEFIRDDDGYLAFFSLSSVFGLAGLENLAGSFLWDAFPDEHDDFSFQVILASVCNFARRCHAGELPIPKPPEEVAGKSGLLVTAYDLYHHPTPDIFQRIADLLTEAGYPHLADLVLEEMPEALAQAAGRLV